MGTVEGAAVGSGVGSGDGSELGAAVVGCGVGNPGRYVGLKDGIGVGLLSRVGFEVG